MHDVQLDDLAVDHDPLSHCSLPPLVHLKPASQLVHEAAPASEYVPRGHTSLEIPSLQKNPAGHILRAVEGLGHVYPGPHFN